MAKMLTKLLIVASIVSIAGCSKAPSDEKAEQTAKQPNILFILADDLGYGDLGVYGQDKIKTPNIDNLATGGIMFTQHYAGSAVCGPSRASLLTGMHTGHGSMRGNPGWNAEGIEQEMAKDDVTVAEALKTAGYQTALIGKWGMADRSEMNLDAMPNQQGFDFFYGYKTHGAAHSYYAKNLYRNNDLEVLEGNNPKTNEGQYTHDLFTKEAKQYLSSTDKNKPFYLQLSYTIPHLAVTVPADSKKQYLELGWPKRPMGKGHYKNDPEGNTAYAGMISRMDRDIGEIIELLKKDGRLENTLVIFTSDNGHEYDKKFFDSNGPLRGKKRDLYEGGVRIPFIAYWPENIKPGQTTDHISAFWDFMATACDVAGINDTCPKNDGISYVPTLLGQADKQQAHKNLYWEFSERRGPTQALRQGDWKLVKLHGKPLQLFNLKDDIGEEKNIASEHPEKLAELEKELAAARTEHPLYPLAKFKKGKKLDPAKNNKKS